MATVAERNNNPGNLILNKIIYQGQTGIDERGFAIFDSQASGIRAADLNLQTYAKHGYDTIHEVIFGTTGTNGWSRTDQKAYEEYIAKNMNIGVNDHIDLNNPDVRHGVLAQIFNFESGSNRYSQGVLSNSWADIMAAANSGNPIDVAGAVGTAIFDNTTNVIDNVGTAINDAVGGAADGIQNWIEGEGLKRYIIPVAVGLGAIMLVLVSSWGLVKDTGIGKLAKSGAKLGLI